MHDIRAKLLEYEIKNIGYIKKLKIPKVNFEK